MRSVHVFGAIACLVAQALGEFVSEVRFYDTGDCSGPEELEKIVEGGACSQVNAASGDFKVKCVSQAASAEPTWTATFYASKDVSCANTTTISTGDSRVCKSTGATKSMWVKCNDVGPTLPQAYSPAAVNLKTYSGTDCTAMEVERDSNTGACALFNDASGDYRITCKEAAGFTTWTYEPFTSKDTTCVGARPGPPLTGINGKCLTVKGGRAYYKVTCTPDVPGPAPPTSAPGPASPTSAPTAGVSSASRGAVMALSLFALPAAWALCAFLI